MFKQISTSHPGYINHQRIQNYLNNEVENYQNTPIAISNQKALFQIFTIFATITALTLTNENKSLDHKLGIISLASLTGLSLLRAKRQKEEAKVALFSSAEEKFERNEILNSNAKTLNFLSTPFYSIRDKAIISFNKKTNKISTISNISILTLTACTLSTPVYVGYALTGFAVTVAGENLLRLKNAHQTLKKIKSTLPQGIHLPTLRNEHIKD